MRALSFTPMMMSPGSSPARCAGPPGSTLETRTTNLPCTVIASPVNPRPVSADLASRAAAGGGHDLGPSDPGARSMAAGRGSSAELRPGLFDVNSNQSAPAPSQPPFAPG